MRYYKQIKNGYIISVGIGNGCYEITEHEYDEILAVIHNIPRKDGYAYLLKEDFTWEEVQEEPVEPPISEYEALDILLGGEL